MCESGDLNLASLQQHSYFF